MKQLAIYDTETDDIEFIDGVVTSIRQEESFYPAHQQFPQDLKFTLELRLNRMSDAESIYKLIQQYMDGDTGIVRRQHVHLQNSPGTTSAPIKYNKVVKRKSTIKEEQDKIEIQCKEKEEFF